MSHKTTIPPKYYQPSIPFTEDERQELDVFFEDHPTLIRGESFREWILEEVREGGK